MILTVNNQVFEDGSTYRGTLKALAHTMVATKYNLEKMLNLMKIGSQISKGGGIILKVVCKSLSKNALFCTRGKIAMCVTIGVNDELFRVY